MAANQTQISEKDHNFRFIAYSAASNGNETDKDNSEKHEESKSDGIYNLQSILDSFNAPLNEEQAWAICYQCAKHYTDHRSESDSEFYQRISSFSHRQSLDYVFLKNDGELTVGIKRRKSSTSNNNNGNGSKTDPVTDHLHHEAEFLEAIGFITYKALDHGLTETEERCLSPGLEELITKLTMSAACADSDNDEGIGHESGSNVTSCQEVIQVCCRRLEAPGSAPDHYKAVCRALVAEAVELRSFLEKISQGEEWLVLAAVVLLLAVGSVELVTAREDAERERLENLGKHDWARLWIHVLGVLRHGVKLKKIEQPHSRDSEFELTPYEMLMEDIRSRRYTLNKVTIEDNIPIHVKKSAHDMILEFIRSRPPLNPAQSRRLRSPPAANPSERDQLMTSIRSDPRQNLRPVERDRYVETSRCRLFEDSVSPTPVKKLIKADLSLFQSHSDEETGVSDTDDVDETDYTTDDDSVFTFRQKVTPQELEPLTPLDSPPMPWQRRVARDLVSQSSVDSCYSIKKERRHSITVCESPAPWKNDKTPQHWPQETIFEGEPSNDRSDSLPSIVVKEGSDADDEDTPTDDTRDSGLSSEFHFEHLAKTAQFIWPHAKLKDPLQCLSLTVEEVMHIRNVLTKAELECLISNKELYDLVSKGKICFTCKKVKFSIFGQWANKCKFCKRAVCNNCIRKMGVPSDRFSNVPVYTLSPSPLSPGSEKSLFKFGPTGSAPSSPRSPATMLTSPPKDRNPPQLHSPENKLAELSGPQMTICKDCKIMIVNIIRASRCTLLKAKKDQKQRAQARKEFITGKVGRSNMKLDLKPIYKKT